MKKLILLFLMSCFCFAEDVLDEIDYIHTRLVKCANRHIDKTALILFQIAKYDDSEKKAEYIMMYLDQIKQDCPTESKALSTFLRDYPKIENELIIFQISLMQGVLAELLEKSSNKLTQKANRSLKRKLNGTK